MVVCFWCARKCARSIFTCPIFTCSVSCLFVFQISLELLNPPSLRPHSDRPCLELIIFSSNCLVFLFLQDKFREETKGRFRKRVVLVNVPSFRVFVPEEHVNGPSFWFTFRGNIERTLVPVFVPGNFCQNDPFGNHPSFCEPAKIAGISLKAILLSPLRKS